MANPVFDNAQAAITNALGAVEAELQRLAGVQQHLDALQVQRRELQATVNQLAQQIPEHRQAIADAQESAKVILDGARKEKDRITSETLDSASDIVKNAHNAAERIISDAKYEAARSLEAVQQSKEELAAIRDQIKVANSQVDAARNTFARLKQHAGAFAQLETD